MALTAVAPTEQTSTTEAPQFDPHSLTAEETRHLMHRRGTLAYAETLKRRRPMDKLARDITRTARAVESGDGRVFTCIPLEFAIELALHQGLHPGDDLIFVAVEQQVLDRMTSPLLTWSEIEIWLARMNWTESRLAHRLGITTDAVKNWRAGRNSISQKQSDAIRALMKETQR